MDFQKDNSIFEHKRLLIDFSLPVLVFFYPLEPTLIPLGV